MLKDIKISDMYLSNLGGGTSAWAAIEPPENEAAYPEASMFGTLPARGFFLRHARNLEFSNIEIATEKPDQRPAIWAHAVDGLDLFRIRIGRGTPAFALSNVQDFRSFGSRDAKDTALEKVDHITL